MAHLLIALILAIIAEVPPAGMDPPTECCVGSFQEAPPAPATDNRPTSRLRACSIQSDGMSPWDDEVELPDDPEGDEPDEPRDALRPEKTVRMQLALLSIRERAEAVTSGRPLAAPLASPLDHPALLNILCRLLI